MPDATFACPDLTTFCRLEELGLEVAWQPKAQASGAGLPGSGARTSVADATRRWDIAPRTLRMMRRFPDPPVAAIVDRVTPNAHNIKNRHPVLPVAHQHD